MKKQKNLFYEIIINGYYKKVGIIYSLKPCNYPLIQDGKEIKNYNDIQLGLKDGNYADFDRCINGGNLVSEELKDLFISYMGDNPNIEFLPVKVVSKEYGDRIYYIMHFKIIYDVIDKKHSVYVPGTDSIIKRCLLWEKVKDLHVFNSMRYADDVIISDEVRRAMIRKKLKAGIIFTPVWTDKELRDASC